MKYTVHTPTVHTLTAHTLTALGVMTLVGLDVMPLAAQPVVIGDMVQEKATVESVDQKTRMVLLRGEHGELDTIIASPAVRNLAQVHPGDNVVVSVQRSLMLEMSKAGSAPVTAAEGTAGRAKLGARPGAFRSETIHARVQIVAVDPAQRTVSFVGPARILRVVQISDPRLLEFARTLNAGDEVDVTYGIGIAASVVPAARGS